MKASTRIEWTDVLVRATAIVESYDTSVTLRQLFYRLVSEQLIPNSNSAYKRLSELTAEERRNGEFPALIDRGRHIHRAPSWNSPEALLGAARDQYRLDRTQGQDVSVYIGVEKAGMVVQLEAWFGELGIPIIALGGYSSQTYVDDIGKDVSMQDRPAVLLYGGDFDPSGEDIDRDFIERGNCWDSVVRVALTDEQVDRFDLPENPGKATDSRAAGFEQRHGKLVQVELDALPPETLRELFQSALNQHWNQSAYDAVLEREEVGRARLTKALAAMRRQP